MEWGKWSGVNGKWVNVTGFNVRMINEVGEWEGGVWK